MKAILPLSALVLTSLATEPGHVVEEIVFEPEAGTSVRRTFEAITELTLDEMKITVDGEDQDAESGDHEIEHLERIVVTDELVEVDDGRPTELRRTFDELLQKGTYTIEGADEDVEENLQSDLEGTTVVFEWDADDEEYSVELAEEEEIDDEELLENLAEDMGFRLVLPDGEVEVDESWEIDPRAYLVVMWPGGLLGFYDEEADGRDESSTERNRQIIDSLEGEGEATFKGVREEDGVRVAVIAVTLDITCESESTQESEQGDMETTTSLSRELEGELLWNLETGMLLSAQLTADAQMVQSSTQSFEIPDTGDEIEVERSLHYSGTISYTVEIETL